MSSKFSSIYIARSGDTLESIAVAYRLSSHRAVLELPKNTYLGNLTAREVLDVGTIVHIPPNAGELLKERLYALHVVRPLLLAHFDEQVSIAERDLRDAVLADTVPSDPDDVGRALAGLEALVGTGMRDISQACISLAEIGRGIVETHVATSSDRSILDSTVGDMTGLYWAVSAQYVGVWAGMWGIELWADKWQNRDAAAAWRAVDQYINTVRSIVVQQADARIRETLALERSLLAERQH